MRKTTSIRFLLVGFIVFVITLSLLLFSGREITPQSSLKDVAAVITTPPPGASITVPPPVETVTFPSSTPGTPYVPPTQPPYPPPPPTIPITPQPTSSETITPNPRPSITASAPQQATLSSANIAWGVETTNTLVIWTGVYSDLPTPHISTAKAVAGYSTDSDLKLLDLSFSPNGQSLAVLSIQPLDGEGISPKWLSVIDLTTNVVQNIPDYSSHYDLYQQYFLGPPDRVLGWLDNNRLAIPKGNTPIRVAIATKDGASYAELPFPPEYQSAPETALSPDRTTFFSLVIASGGSFWLYGTDGSNPVNLDMARAAYYPIWSPNSKYIAFTSPKVVEMQDGTHQADYFHPGVWLLEPNTPSQSLVSGEDAWNVGPAWSLDSSKLAFLRADASVTSNDDAGYNRPEGVNTNIFIANVSDLTPYKLTNFTGVKNSSLQWTSGGNIVLSSTINSTTGTRGIVAVSTVDGSSTTLVSGSPGQSLTHPVMVQGSSDSLPGMPNTGETKP